MKHQGLDHLAIAVPDTEEALKIWRDKLGFPVLYSEDVNGGTVRLTHLDLGNTHCSSCSRSRRIIRCMRGWRTMDRACTISASRWRMSASQGKFPRADRATLHQGTQGKRALFLDKAATQGVQVELTGK